MIQLIVTLLLSMSIFAQDSIDPFAPTEDNKDQTNSVPDVNYQSPQRSEWIERSLEAFTLAAPDQPMNTYKYLKNISDYSCSSPSQQLRLQCLIQAGQNSCKGFKGVRGKTCNHISDIVVTNLTEEGLFLTRSERVKILKRSGTKNDQYLKAIFRKYATTTTKFFMDKKFECGAADLPCLAESVNTYCLKQADAREMSWQGCVGAIVWFVGTNMKERKSNVR